MHDECALCREMARYGDVIPHAPRPVLDADLAVALLYGKDEPMPLEDDDTAWRRNHVWGDAREEALSRAALPDGFLCAHCGNVVGIEDVEVNHVIPIRGRHNRPGCQHHQDNLEVLCAGCHRDVTRRQRANGWKPVRRQRRALEPTLF